ncbi:CHAD domain-containing protein [Cellulomonas timonensis]|uniref:CHAD domain-containing protein n=1 Tax=Cellulomonas timonensis TaxID=1689271 RepID=UPI00082FA355|nr:CHAD domain-containing protein [Cellulomonas timonensis]
MAGLAAEEANPDAGGLVLRRLADQAAQLAAQEPGVRAADPEAVHDMRVATRRLRSALGTFRPVLLRARTAPLRDDLRRVGRRLGQARDADVSRAGLGDLLAEVPAGLVIGPVRTRLDADRGSAYEAALARVVEDLDGPDWAALRARVAELVADPPLTSAASRGIDEVLLPRVDRAFRRLSRAWRAARAEQSGAQRDAALHEARKEARQARYAAETLAPVVGQDAVRSARAAERVQDLLGSHQDLVVLRGVLRRAAVEAPLAGGNAFTYGLLHDQARVRALELEQQLPHLARRATRPGRRAWMR